MHSTSVELLPIQLAHAHFADWERVKHRAEFFAILAFPDTHPLRHALEHVSRGLEEHRWVAEATVADVAKKHGSFCADVNGFHFEDVAAWFKDGSDIYYDCPASASARACAEATPCTYKASQVSATLRGAAKASPTPS